ncbi:DUF6412 domain-containing protein [Nocardia callitridis]|uniref:Secreted protein n=1 Tax=Nocardia callitridis TaxID=648753 RepID=A0ABP9K7B6_9NOCA
MMTRVRSLTYAVLAFVVPVLALCAIPVGEPAAMAAVGIVAATLVVAVVALHAGDRFVVPVSNSGPPPSAQSRRRGHFLRQSNPDTPGRPRPRAPGFAAA